jgi:hypothetical protein
MGTLIRGFLWALGALGFAGAAYNELHAFLSTYITYHHCLMVNSAIFAGSNTQLVCVTMLPQPDPARLIAGIIYGVIALILIVPAAHHLKLWLSIRGK